MSLIQIDRFQEHRVDYDEVTDTNENPSENNKQYEKKSYLEAERLWSCGVKIGSSLSHEEQGLLIAPKRLF